MRARSIPPPSPCHDVQQGSTGLCGVRILELGCGAGLCALAAAWSLLSAARARCSTFHLFWCQLPRWSLIRHDGCTTETASRKLEVTLSLSPRKHVDLRDVVSKRKERKERTQQPYQAGSTSKLSMYTNLVFALACAGIASCPPPIFIALLVFLLLLAPLCNALQCSKSGFIRRWGNHDCRRRRSHGGCCRRHWRNLSL